MQVEPYHNKPIEDSHAASYLNPNPHSSYVPRSLQISSTDHSQNFNFTMQAANENCPATTGYTSIPAFSSYPCYRTPNNASAHHPIPSLWETRSGQHTYASFNPVSDRHYPKNFENASMHRRYDQPCVQTNHRQMTGSSYDSISSEYERLDHFSPQSISQPQITNFASANANFPPQEQEQPAQNKHDQYPRRSPLPCAPTIEPQSTSTRARKFWSRLKAGSGVVIASQLRPGSSPSRPIELTKLRRAGRVRDVSCPICGGLFAKPYHLQGHFPVCVQRNGNPNGLFWDETLPLRWRRYGKCDTDRDDKLN